VITSDGLEQMRREVDKIHVDQAILEYIVTLIGKTRQNPDLILGASPRASIAITSISKAAAYLQGRDYVVPGDIAPLFVDTLAHRLLLRPGAENENVNVDKILNGIIRNVQTPRVG